MAPNKRLCVPATFGDNDFLLGRAKFCYHNGGNQLMRQLVERLSAAYEAADKMCDYLDTNKRDKRAIREEVIAAIKASGGIFIKVNKDRECLEELSDMKSIHQVVVEQFRTARRRLQNKKDGDSEPPTPTTTNKKVAPSPDSPELQDELVKRLVTRVSDELESLPGQSSDSFVADIPLDELDSLGPHRTTSEHDHSIAGHSSALSWNTYALPLSSHHTRPAPSSDLMSFEDLVSHTTRMSLGVETRVSNQESCMHTATIDGTIGTFGTMSKHSAIRSQAPMATLSRAFDAPREIISACDSGVLKDHDENRDIPRLVRNNLKNESFLVELMDVLIGYDEDNEALIDVEESGLHLLLIDIVKLYPFNCDLQRDGLYALGNLAISDKNQVAIAKAGGISLAIGAMLRFESNNWVLRRACHLLGNLSKNMENNAIVVQSGGICLVANAMRKFPDIELVQQNGCHAIGNFARNVENNFAIEQAGGLTLVLAAMEQFPTIDQLQWYGCLLLAHVTYEREEDRLQAIASAGGVDLLLAAMRAFLKTNERIERYGCCALGNFAVADTNKVAIAEKGGIEAILAAMNEHQSGERGQLYGCFALGTLAEDETNRALICKLGGIKAIVDATKAFPGNEELLDEACYALCNLAKSAAWFWNRVGSSEGPMFKAVRAAMERIPSAPRRMFRSLQKFSEFQ